MNVRGHSYCECLDKKWNSLPGNFLKLWYYTDFYKTTLRYVKTATLYLYLEQRIKYCRDAALKRTN